MSSLITMVDQHYGYLDEIDPASYVLALPIDISNINPHIVDKAPEKLKNWVVMDSKIVEGTFWKALMGKKCADQYDIPRINLALEMIKAHDGYQQRKSKALFYTHPIHVATEVIRHTDNEDVIIAALLHDTAEDTSKTMEEVRLAFGEKVSSITHLLTNLESGFKKYKLPKENQKVSKLKASQNRDAILVKLCDRLHNMRTLSAKAPEKRIKKAKETSNNCLPLARELGFGNLAQELENLCKPYLTAKDEA